MSIELIYYNQNRLSKIFSFDDDTEAQSVIYKRRNYRYLGFLLDNIEACEPIDTISVRYTFFRLNIDADFSQIKYLSQWYEYIKKSLSDLFLLARTDEYIYNLIKEIFNKYDVHFSKQNNFLAMVLSEKVITEIVPENFYSRKFEKLCYYDRRINYFDVERAYKSLMRPVIINPEFSTTTTH